MALIFAVYSGVTGCGFVSLDDSSHVYENEVVRGGVTWAGVQRAFSEPHASLWVPLTTLSFMADVSVFGLSPSAFHLENVAWHAAAAVLLFLALRALTGRVWASALVAALFGVHPINVESVAWITERKNVLCGFFSLLTLWCWAHYARAGKWWPWFAAHGAFALALLAKPMAVPLPAALLLLDAWPLRRWRVLPWWRLLAEKSLLFALAVTSSRVTLWATAPRGSLVTFAELPFASRLTNALTACVTYLGQLVCPRDFAVLYPHPVVARWGPALAALALLLALTGAAWRWRKTQPWLLTGWLFFLGMIVPTMGLVQVGSQAHAGRFTYLAQMGIFVALVWSADHLWPAVASRWRAPAAGVVLVALAAGTMAEVPVWTDSLTLFEHSLAVTGPHPQVLDLLATTHARRGDDTTAVHYWRDSLERLPDNAPSWNSLGAALLRLGRDAEARECFQNALKWDPKSEVAAFNLASALDRAGDRVAAKAMFERALALDPAFAQAHYRLGLLLEAEGSPGPARAHFTEAAQLRPGDPMVAEALRRLDAATPR